MYKVIWYYDIEILILILMKTSFFEKKNAATDRNYRKDLSEKDFTSTFIHNIEIGSKEYS